MQMLVGLGALALLSVIVNFILIHKLRAVRAKPQMALDAKDLIHDLTKKGAALVRIQVLDPEGLFMTRGGR